MLEKILKKLIEEEDDLNFCAALMIQNNFKKYIENKKNKNIIKIQSIYRMYRLRINTRRGNLNNNLNRQVNNQNRDFNNRNEDNNNQNRNLNNRNENLRQVLDRTTNILNNINTPTNNQNLPQINNLRQQRDLEPNLDYRFRTETRNSVLPNIPPIISNVFPNIDNRYRENLPNRLNNFERENNTTREQRPHTLFNERINYRYRDRVVDPRREIR